MSRRSASSLQLETTLVFSTGPHSHIGFYRVDFDGKNIKFLDTNDANNSFNPYSYFQPALFAVNQASWSTLVRSNLRYYKYILWDCSCA